MNQYIELTSDILFVCLLLFFLVFVYGIITFQHRLRLLTKKNWTIIDYRRYGRILEHLKELRRRMYRSRSY